MRLTRARRVTSGVALLALTCATALASVSPAAAASGDLPTVDTGSFGSSTSQIVDPPAGNPDSLSCPTSQFCALADRTGHVTFLVGGQWGHPELVDSAADVARGTTYTPPGLDSVSCSSSSFCLAVDSSGAVFAYDGSSWSMARSGGAVDTVVSVSCPDDGECMILDGTVQSFDHGAFGSAGSPGTLDAVGMSCSSLEDCMAIGDGAVARYDGTSWTQSTVFPEEQASGNAAISCTSSDFCAALAGNEESFLVDGAWTTPVVSGTTPQYGNSISCTSDQSCLLAVGHTVRTDTPEGQGDSISLSDDAGTRLVSCSAARSCVAVDGDGRATTEDETWGEPELIDPAGGDLTSVSCPMVSFCMAVDASGRTLHFDGSSWSAPAQTDPDVQFAQVSCSSATFCAAVGWWHLSGSDGLLATYQDGAWRLSPTDRVYQAVSCSSSSFCLAVARGSDGSTVWNGTSWSQGPQSASAATVSCTSATWCSTGVQVFDGTSWADAALPAQFDDTDPDDGSVSCPAQGSCLYLDDNHLALLQGSQWSFLGREYATDTGNLSCSSTRFCLVAGAPLMDGAIDTSMYVPLSSNGQTGGRAPALVANSCPTATMCVAVDPQGATVWHTGFTLPTAVGPASMSAPADSTVELSLTPSGSPAPAIQWQRSVDGGPWTDLADETDDTVDVPVGTSAVRYRATLTNLVGTGYSRTAVATVANPPVAHPVVRPHITRQPVDRSVRFGTRIVLHAAANGSAPMRIVWERRARHRHHWRVVGGAHSTSLRIRVTRSNSGAAYRAIFSNGAGGAATRAATVRGHRH